jgi:hypothetical protein
MPAISLPDVSLPEVGLPDVGLPDVDLSSLPVPRSPAAFEQLAQELSIAALLGGNLYGRLAMHPALGQISDPSERGKVLNRTWRRYGSVNSLAVAGLLAGWVPARRRVLGARRVSRRDRALVTAKDVAIGAVALTGFASALGGIGFASTAPEGAVPLADGTEPAPETPRRAASLKRALNTLGALNLAAEVAFVALDAAIIPRRPRWSPRG